MPGDDLEDAPLETGLEHFGQLCEMVRDFPLDYRLTGICSFPKNGFPRADWRGWDTKLTLNPFDVIPSSTQLTPWAMKISLRKISTPSISPPIQYPKITDIDGKGHEKDVGEKSKKNQWMFSPRSQLKSTFPHRVKCSLKTYLNEGILIWNYPFAIKKNSLNLTQVVCILAQEISF